MAITKAVTREKSPAKKNAAEKLEAGDEERGVRGAGKIQAGEKLGYVREVVELAPACQRELPAPIEANSEQEWRLEAVNATEKCAVKFAQARDQCVHGAIRCAGAEKVSPAPRGRARGAEPAKTGPVLEPC